jgi:hypothetical protein
MSSGVWVIKCVFVNERAFSEWKVVGEVLASRLRKLKPNSRFLPPKKMKWFSPKKCWRRGEQSDRDRPPKRVPSTFRFEFYKIKLNIILWTTRFPPNRSGAKTEAVRFPIFNFSIELHQYQCRCIKYWLDVVLVKETHKKFYANYFDSFSLRFTSLLTSFTFLSGFGFYIHYETVGVGETFLLSCCSNASEITVRS